MTHLNDLRHFLLRASVDGGPDTSSIAYDDASDGVARLLLQIDRQVVEQRLEFTFEDGARVACVAAERRLLRLLEPAPRNLSPQIVALFVKSELDQEDVRDIGELLMALCERGREFSVRNMPGAPDGAAALNGVSVVAIARSLDIALPGTPDPAGDGLEAFIAAILPQARACLQLQDDEPVVLKGADAELDEVMMWANAAEDGVLSPGFPLFGTLETQGVMVLGSRRGKGTHVVIAGRLGAFVIATVNGQDTTSTLDLWREASLSDDPVLPE